MPTKLFKFISVSLILGLAAGASAETVCGHVTDDQPEIAANLDELRKFTITDKQGGAHAVFTEIDPDFIRGASLRAIREAKQNRIEICVTGSEVLGSGTKHLMILTVERSNPAKTTLEDSVARAATDSSATK